jgi:hypothetical protein
MFNFNTTFNAFVRQNYSRQLSTDAYAETASSIATINSIIVKKLIKFEQLTKASHTILAKLNETVFPVACGNSEDK